MGSYQELWTDEPLPTVIKSYLYHQYQDDADLQGFVNAFNGMAQGYYAWFIDTPLAIYTNPNINGPLLDWTGTNLYGTERPVVATSSVSERGWINTVPVNTTPVNGFVFSQSGTAQIATDDIYKRVLTWILYKGDGMQSSLIWLRRRIARFLYGVGGTDIPDLGLTANIGLSILDTQKVGAIDTMVINTLPVNEFSLASFNAAHIIITIPAGPLADTFMALFNAGLLPVPFQITYYVEIA